MTEEKVNKMSMAVLKIIRMGLESRVYNEMKKPGFSVEALSREFRSEGKTVSAQSIRKFIKKTKKAQQLLISQDLRTAEMYKQTVMDYSKALKDILKEVEEVKQQTKDSKDYSAYNQMVGRIMQGIELIAKLSGDMKPKGAIDINILYQEINTNVEQQMKDVKKEIFGKQTINVDAEITENDTNNEKKINRWVK